MVLRCILFALVLLALCLSRGASVNDGFDDHVDEILNQFADEDDAAGIEPESPLKHLKTVAGVKDFIKVSLTRSLNELSFH